MIFVIFGMLVLFRARRLKVAPRLNFEHFNRQNGLGLGLLGRLWLIGDVSKLRLKSCGAILFDNSTIIDAKLYRLHASISSWPPQTSCSLSKCSLYPYTCYQLRVAPGAL